jgi:hypothetical protein
VCSRWSRWSRWTRLKFQSEWIAYHKKNKTVKTPPVTGPDVQADWNDSCKYSSELFLEFRANTAIQNSGSPPPPTDTIPTTPLQQSSTFKFQPEPKDAEPETDFSEEYN